MKKYPINLVSDTVCVLTHLLDPGWLVHPFPFLLLNIGTYIGKPRDGQYQQGQKKGGFLGRSEHVKKSFSSLLL